VNHGGRLPAGSRIHESMEARASCVPDPGPERLDQELKRIMAARRRPGTEVDQELERIRAAMLLRLMTEVDQERCTAARRRPGTGDPGPEPGWEPGLPRLELMAPWLELLASVAVAVVPAVAVVAVLLAVHPPVSIVLGVVLGVLMGGTVCARYAWHAVVGADLAERCLRAVRERKARGRGTALSAIPDPPGWLGL